MSVFDGVFYGFSALVVGSAAVMVFSRNVIYSAVALLLTFFGVAGIYVLLAADFVAIAQVLVYIGGILVLLLFGVMLSRRITNIEMSSGTLQFLPAVLVVAGVLLMLIRVAVSTDWAVIIPSEFEPTTATLGTLLMTTYLIPFEMVSVLLLGALIGAAFIARKD